MKKIVLSILLLCSLVSFSQDVKDDKSKFSLSLHYIGNLDDDNLVNHDYNGVVGLDVRYSFYHNNKIIISAGLGIDYLQESSNFFKNDALIFNPNIGIEVNVFNSKLKPFFNLGYSFFKYKINFEPFNPDPIINPQSAEFSDNFKGISLNPGLRYHFSDVFFAEGSYRYVGFNSDSMTGTSKTHYIQIGIGFKF